MSGDVPNIFDEAFPRELQVEAYRMRKTFTDYLRKNIMGQQCVIQFNCHEKTQATAKLEVFNSSLDTFGCSELQTPLSKVENALLRSADVAFIEVKTGDEK